ncbi:pentapeptide repeat-containing protein [Flavonifractor plautii]|uniref:pentapeptide repeat-containing protein n=4 Tax=Flavonifractor plautii TaxID=292800 RepID=UPI00287E6C71|nr:pentapeptide repeat-containing protein [Flavonifractor plautii]MDS9667167.1 pentapeptide repeat-containing protein [Flavonifractor plautii]MDS9667216.1 pentapeptide repeat-containing protein [Flavonifractor plautii]
MDLKKILDEHLLWLNGEGGSCANLFGANLRGANLSDADLRCANLFGANLRGANLSDADLRCANLSDADLRCANLRNADLRGANLSDADLRCANLSNADLFGANLRGANLSDANLRNADLRNADLRNADLCRADLSNADLRCADLRNADLCRADLCEASIDQMMWNIYTVFYPLQCPESGSYIGYKKASGLVVELEIPADARRSSATSRKCRASKAKVLSITDINGNPAGGQVKSNYDPNFVYAIGETVEVTDFDDNRWNECSTGIHHFITRAEAVIYE